MTTHGAGPGALGDLRLPWPLPALLTWGAAWAAGAGLAAAGLPFGLAAAAAAGAVLAGAWPQRSRLRRVIVLGGFALSVAAAGVTLPAWAWLLPGAMLLLLYPRRAWRDAPLFPTPPGALDALGDATGLPPGARVLDAGCGLGHGLRALRRAFPQGSISGVESSALLAAVARRRCRFADVRRGDMWARSWREQDLVYLFQRPESVPRALAKAEAEMAPGGWLASLEFEAQGRAADAVLRCPDGRPLWLYRVPPGPVPAASSRTKRLR